MQISFAVTAKLICVFVFAYAKRLFSHDAAHILPVMNAFAGIILQTPNESSAPIEENKTSISTTVTLPPAQCLMDTQTSNEKETHNENKKAGVRTETRNIGWITCGKRKSEDLEAHDLGSSRDMKKCCIVSPMKHSVPANEDNISSAGDKVCM